MQILPNMKAKLLAKGSGKTYLVLNSMQHEPKQNNFQRVYFPKEIGKFSSENPYNKTFNKIFSNCSTVA